MSERQPFSFERLQEKIAQTARSGQNVRQQMELQFRDLLHRVDLDTEGCRRLASSILDGARDGLRGSPADQRQSRLQEIFDGLADGMLASAQTIQLTIEEARSQGQYFADNDLRQAAQNLRALGVLFKSVLEDTAHQASQEFREQWDQTKHHARQAWERTRPAVDHAIQTVSEHPLATGKEALQSGLQAARKATGALFSEMGKRLESLGNHMRS